MGLGDMKDMFSQMRTAQKQMKQFQKEMSKMRIEVETGAGMVKAVVDGEANLIDLIVDDSMVSADEIKILPNLIKKAIQEAQKKAKSQVQSQVQSMAGGMNIPGME